MNTSQRLLALILLAASSLVWGAPFENEVLRLEVPKGFGGPIAGKMDDQATVVAFTKPHSGASTSTLLQVTTYNPGASAPPPKEQLGVLADKYLPQFLAGIERRRTSYTATAPRRVTLGGIPASMASWSGMVEGLPAHGTMYCAIVGTKIVSLHVQDLVSAPSSNFQEAEASIKAVRFRMGG
jgi:hypothetical protein